METNAYSGRGLDLRFRLFDSDDVDRAITALQRLRAVMPGPVVEQAASPATQPSPTFAAQPVLPAPSPTTNAPPVETPAEPPEATLDAVRDAMLTLYNRQPDGGEQIIKLKQQFGFATVADLPAEKLPELLAAVLAA